MIAFIPTVDELFNTALWIFLWVLTAFVLVCVASLIGSALKRASAPVSTEEPETETRRLELNAIVIGRIEKKS